MVTLDLLEQIVLKDLSRFRRINHFANVIHTNQVFLCWLGHCKMSFYYPTNHE